MSKQREANAGAQRALTAALTLARNNRPDAVDRARLPTLMKFSASGPLCVLFSFHVRNSPGPGQQAHVLLIGSVRRFSLRQIRSRTKESVCSSGEFNVD